MTTTEKLKRAKEFLGGKYCLHGDMRAHRRTPFDPQIPVFRFCFPNSVTAASQMQRR